MERRNATKIELLWDNRTCKSTYWYEFRERDLSRRATQIRPGGVREVIVGEVLSREQVIDKKKTLLRTFAHGSGMK